MPRLEHDAIKSQLLFTGTICDSILFKLLSQNSLTSQETIESTILRTFKPIPLGVTIKVNFQTKPKLILSNNVVGVVSGTNKTLNNEHIVISAQWDAFGFKKPIDGDSICNGALDDGSGLTSALALARVFAANPQPRSITFLFCTAEELGLLGSDAFVRFGPLSSKNIIANFNIDEGTELFGRKIDVAPLGIEQSSLGITVSKIASKKGLRVSNDPYPEEGYFLRADNYSFAKFGIPALYMGLGTKDIDHDPGWTNSKNEEYINKHYHQVSDNYENVVLDLRGAVQLAEFTRDLIYDIANSKEKPKWLPSSEFDRLDHK